MPLYYPELYASIGGNTSGTLADISTGTLFLAGGSNITLSQSQNSVTLIGGAGGGGGAFSAGISTQGNTESQSGLVGNQILFVGTDNMTLRQATTTGGSATLSFFGAPQPYLGVSTGGNTKDETGVDQYRSYVFEGHGACQLSQSIDAGNKAATLWIDVQAGAQTYSNEALYRPHMLNQSVHTSLGQNSIYLWPFRIEDTVQGSQIRMPVSINASSSAVSSARVGYTMQFGLYTKNGSSLSRFYSSSWTLSGSMSSNVSQLYAFISNLSNSTSYQPTSSSSAGLNLSSLFHGARDLIFPIETALAPRDYWGAFVWSSSGAGTVGNFLRMSALAATGTNYVRLGFANNVSQPGLNRDWGMGSFSTTSNALPVSIAMTAIRGGNTQLAWNYMRSTF